MNLTRPEKKLSLLLRSVYLKGHQDALLKTADMSWEDKIIKDIEDLFSAYQNQQMVGLEELIRKYIKAECFDDMDMAYADMQIKDLATKIRDLLSQKGGENEKR